MWALKSEPNRRRLAGPGDEPLHAGSWPWVIALVLSQPNAYRLVKAVFSGVALLILACSMGFCGRPVERSVSSVLLDVIAARISRCVWASPARPGYACDRSCQTNCRAPRK